MPKGTLYGWMKALREGRLEAGPGSRTPNEAMSLAEEMTGQHAIAGAPTLFHLSLMPFAERYGHNEAET